MSWVDDFMNATYEPSRVVKVTKPKGKRRPEDILQEGICTFLNHALPKDAWYCSIPNGSVLRGDETQRKIQMSRLKATGLTVGAPDLIMFYQARPYAFEVKIPTGRLSPSQVEVAERLLKAGVRYSVITSTEHLQEYLLQQGVPLRARVGSLFK